MKHGLIATVAIALLAVGSCSLPASAYASRLYPQWDNAEVRNLVDLATTNLQAQLDAQTREIVVQSVEPLLTPYSHRALRDAGWDDPYGSSSGYTIRLAVGRSVYEYHGRVIGSTYVLWRELTQPLSGRPSL